jgi:hypothetical protein
MQLLLSEMNQTKINSQVLSISQNLAIYRILSPLTNGELPKVAKIAAGIDGNATNHYKYFQTVFAYRCETPLRAYWKDIGYGVAICSSSRLSMRLADRGATEFPDRADLL